jgi:Flp pilus assembly protein TadG
MKKRALANTDRGWTTMEFLITFPLLFAAFLMVLHYGLLMKTKLSLTNAVHSAAQVYAKTNSCNKAKDYFNANFDKPGAAIVNCSGGQNSEKSQVDAEYIFSGENLPLVIIPPQKLKATAVAFSEKE